MPFDMKEITNALNLINIGCEMIYVINHRLGSLDIEGGKAKKTLEDITKTLFSKRIEDLIYTKRSLFTLEGIKNSLDKVCHCSIITLDSVSFSKLFEMIVMAFKRQLLLSPNSFAIYHITKNHISGVNKIINDSKITKPIFDRFLMKFSEMDNYDYYSYRKSILNMFAHKNCKVSFYLNDGTQSNDSNILIKPCEVASFNVEPIGTVK